MKIGLTVTVPKPIYDVYARAAEALGDCTVAQVMSDALQAYVQNITADMLTEGSLSTLPQQERPLYLLEDTSSRQQK